MSSILRVFFSRRRKTGVTCLQTLRSVRQDVSYATSRDTGYKTVAQLLARVKFRGPQ